MQVDPRGAVPAPRASLPTAAPSSMEEARAQALEFESVFLGVMLNEMSTGLGADDGPGGAAYRSMLNEQHARAFAQAGGLGLADTIARELMHLQESRP